jgi:type IX secretion system PorP/SprF family membrane protein
MNDSNFKNMIRKIIFIAAIFAITTGVKAQQEAHFTQFMYNQLYFNPAYAGARGMPSFSLIYRNQWIGFKGAPVSGLLSFNAPLFNDRVGFGLTVHRESAGIFDTWDVAMAYSYNIKISDESSIRLGLQGKMTYLGIDFSDPSVIVRDPTDQSIKYDESTNKYTGNFGAGIHLKIKQMFFGIGAPAFFPSEVGINNNQLIPQIARHSSHFYFIAGTLLPLSNSLQLKPVLLTKYVEGAPISLDLNASLVFNLVFTAGVSYRFTGSSNSKHDSFDILALYQINNVAIGAAYDIPISEISNHTSGSLEILIRYDFIKETTDMANPRFFF